MHARVFVSNKYETLHHRLWQITLSKPMCGVDLASHKIRLVWSGSLVPETDGHTLLKAVSQLPPSVAKNLDIILCGTGSLTPEIERLADKLPHLTYAGWVDAGQLSALTQASHIGLLCYLDRFDFQNSVPNKVVDYCAGAMRILTNLSGEVPRLLSGTDSIISYPTGSVPALVDVLTNIAQNPEKYRQKHPPSRRIFQQHFDANIVFKNYVEYLENIAQP